MSRGTRRLAVDDGGRPVVDDEGRLVYVDEAGENVTIPDDGLVEGQAVVIDPHNPPPPEDLDPENSTPVPAADDPA